MPTGPRHITYASGQVGPRPVAGGRRADFGDERALYKPRWGAFYQTPLQDYLQRPGISTLLFSGCNFPNCPRTSIYEASERDYRVALVEDAVSGLYEQGRTELKNIGVTLMTTQATIEALKALTTQGLQA